jgi:hypothetical protein
MITNIAHTFLNALSILWMVGGILFLPFNSGTCMCFLVARSGMTEERMWWLLKRIWIFEICWNLVFFYTGILGHYLIIAPNTFTIEDLGYAIITGPIFAVVCVFWLPLIEAMILGTLAFIICEPVAATALYGAMALQFAKDAAGIRRAADASHRTRT